MLYKHTKNIYPSFRLNLKQKEEKTYYLKINNTTTALQFSIFLEDVDVFERNDKIKQFFIVFFIGVILSFVTYSFALFIYTKNKSYLYYSFYIFTLLFQQLTYIGFLPLYMPKSFTYWDNLLVVPKVGIMIIAASIFARSFLKTSAFPKLDKIYKGIIVFILLQILFFSTPYFYLPELVVLTGLFFIFFNFFSAIYVYKKGYKQARFFIVGWSFLFVAYFLSIIDALGLFSVMHFLPPLVLAVTMIEALFLLLAFIDKLNILQKEKKNLNKKLYKELEQRKQIIEKEVQFQTKTLKSLYKELHHRVKNNLQIILSIIRLQGQKFEDNFLKEQFIKLENRIKSISKTHEILYLNENIEEIDMYDYLDSLCEDINMSLNNKNIEIQINSNIKMPLKEAVYIGIIINELLSNSIKYAKDCNKISINLYEKKNNIILNILDNGKGYEKSSINTNTLGLQLVKNLVLDQLNGSIEVNSKNKCEYNINFNADYLLKGERYLK